MNSNTQNFVILIAGAAATGKTSFGNWLSKELKIPFFSKDRIKEQIFDSLNENLEYEQKRKIGQASYTVMYGIMEELMKNNCCCIIESNFNKSATEVIDKLKKEFNYKIITVKFECDYKVLHQRFLKRENSCERHKGLLANGVYDDFDKFLEAQKRASDFEFDENDIIIDTTCFKNNLYSDVMDKIKKLLK